MGHETRQCGYCTDGITWTCGNAPTDTRETSTCTKCNGSGQVVVWVYERRA